MAPTIDPDVFTVIVTVDADPSSLVSMISHAASGLEAFARYPGFVGGALHASADGRRMIQYLQWTDESSYLACRDDPVWETSDSAQRFMALVSVGRAHLDERHYRVVSTT